MHILSLWYSPSPLCYASGLSSWQSTCLSASHQWMHVPGPGHYSLDWPALPLQWGQAHHPYGKAYSELLCLSGAGWGMGEQWHWIRNGGGGVFLSKFVTRENGGLTEYFVFEKTKVRGHVCLLLFYIWTRTWYEPCFPHESYKKHPESPPSPFSSLMKRNDRAADLSSKKTKLCCLLLQEKSYSEVCKLSFV